MAEQSNQIVYSAELKYPIAKILFYFQRKKS
jgi:hypothetical protein